VPEVVDLPYEQQGDLIYLPNFPYASYDYEGEIKPRGISLPHCFIMWLRYCGIGGNIRFEDYLEIFASCPETHRADRHKKALLKLGLAVKFTRSADEQDIKDEIKKGNPVIADVPYSGTHIAPNSFGHSVVITGYSNDSWLVQDPIGHLDLFKGHWSDTGGESGRNLLYAFNGFNPRIFMQGGATGHCWLRFSKIEQ